MQYYATIANTFLPAYNDVVYNLPNNSYNQTQSQQQQQHSLSPDID